MVVIQVEGLGRESGRLLVCWIPKSGTKKSSLEELDGLASRAIRLALRVA